MDRRSEIREFLRSRRARITPGEAGLAPYSGVRRVPGLRREEVAQLAGVSVDYYIRLERGHVQGISETVLEAVAEALRLDDTERGYFFDLAQPTPAPARRGRPVTPQKVRPALFHALELLGVPAVVQGRRMDVLAANRLGCALYTDFEARPRRERNLAHFVFLGKAARTLFADWDLVAADCVAMLRRYAGRHPDDPQLVELVGELSARSDIFRRMWGSHDVVAHTNGSKRLHHPIVGDLVLDYEVLTVEGDPEQSLVLYVAEPGSRSAEALDLLASWVSTSATGPHSRQGTSDATTSNGDDGGSASPP